MKEIEILVEVIDTKDRVKEILSNSIDINSSHTSNIINSSIELNKNRIYTWRKIFT